MNISIDTEYDLREHRSRSLPERSVAAAVIHRAAMDILSLKERSMAWEQIKDFFDSKEHHMGSFEWYADAARIQADSLRQFLFSEKRTREEKYKILVRAYAKVKLYLRDKE